MRYLFLMINIERRLYTCQTDATLHQFAYNPDRRNYLYENV